MPVATPVEWEELGPIDRADAFTIADVEKLLKRASSGQLTAWAAGRQLLPTFTKLR
jgi:DNA primase